MFNFLKKRERAEIARLQSEVDRLSKYSKIIDVESHIDSRYKELADDEAKHLQRLDDINAEIEEQKERHKQAKATYDDLNMRIEKLNEIYDYSNYDIINPISTIQYGNSEYCNGLINIRHRQAILIITESWESGNYFWLNSDEWEEFYFNTKNKKVKSLISNLGKLIFRVFQSECDNLIASATIHNYESKKKGILKVYNSIDKLLSKLGLHINIEHYNLKLEELDIIYNYKLFLAREKEEQAEIKERIRDEEKARREYESEIKRAEKEENLYQIALLKAREDLHNEMGGDPIEIQEKIAHLEARLREAMLNKERALSMAQQTKRGHVYVISNIGSFGENVYKIGMTRRLEPFDRVDELGNASVPFKFDVHAMIFSEDAPSLEKTLHNAFADQRVNLINTRKEFFYTTIDEIERVVVKNHAQIEFTKIARALQYRESVTIRKGIRIASTPQEPELSYDL